MNTCLFTSDLHGNISRYIKLFNKIKEEVPAIVFLGGDLLPHRLRKVENYENFATEYLIPNFISLRTVLKDRYPKICLILGNDDARSEENYFKEENTHNLFSYLETNKIQFGDYTIYGYPYVPPTPFQMKDWEKYDVSRYVDPGCIHPTEGFRTVEPTYDTEFATIQADLEELTQKDDMSKAIFLFHSPPYQTNLDRAALDGKTVDYVPMDVHVGSIAIKRFIELRQPFITLHGHIHESTRLTGHWFHQIGKTISMNGSHDGSELAIIKFDIENPSGAKRLLL